MEIMKTKRRIPIFVSIKAYKNLSQQKSKKNSVLAITRKIRTPGSDMMI